MRHLPAGAKLEPMKIATTRQRVILDAAIDRSVVHGALTAPTRDRPDCYGWLEINSTLSAMLEMPEALCGWSNSVSRSDLRCPRDGVQAGVLWSWPSSVREVGEHGDHGDRQRRARVRIAR